MLSFDLYPSLQPPCLKVPENTDVFGLLMRLMKETEGFEENKKVRPFDMHTTQAIMFDMFVHSCGNA